MIKILCCDIDGTLLRNDKSLSDANIKAIQKAVNEKEVKFVLVSGRMLNAVKPFYDMLGIKGPVSCFNGCSLYDPDYKLIDEHRVPRKIARKVIKVAKDKGMELILFNDQQWIIESKYGYCYQSKIRFYKYECQLMKLEEAAKAFEPNKILAMSPFPARIIEFRKALGEAGLTSADLTFYPSSDFLEMMPAGIDKGTAVKSLMSYYGVDASEVMAIGDDFNDIPMFKQAGLSVAMGNAIAQVKSFAKQETDTNENDGLAKAIDRYILSSKNCLIS